METIGRRQCVAAFAAMSFGLLSTGCALPYFLMGKEHMVDPPVALLEGRKDVKRLVVLSYANSQLRFGFDAIDNDLCKLLINEIAAAEPRFEIVADRKVRAWKDVTPDWEQMELQEIGERFDADYVVFVEVNNFSTNEAKNQYLLKGATTVAFRVHDVSHDQTIFDDVYTREYPPHRSVPVTEVSSVQQFQNMFLRAVARELAWYIVPHRRADEIGDF
jgi:hypothetical protein